MSWWSLYIKEFRLTRTKFLINLLFLFMLGLLLFVLMEKYSPYFITLTIPIIIFHVFYLFFAMFDSLRQEWKQKTSFFWLNIPKSGWHLLTAKFAQGATQLFFSLTVTFLISFFLLHQGIKMFTDSVIAELLIEQFQALWWVLFFGIFIAALQYGAVATFIYTMSKSIRKWGWLVGIAIVAGVSWLWSSFQETAIYEGLTKWGAIFNADEVMRSIYFTINEFGGETAVEADVAGDVLIYLGSTIVELLVVVLILVVSAWLLDHKAEA